MSNDIEINGLKTFREEYRRYAARGVANTEAVYTPDDVRALLEGVREWAEAMFSESCKLTLFSNDYEAGRCVGQEDVYGVLLDLLREDDMRH